MGECGIGVGGQFKILGSPIEDGDEEESFLLSGSG